MEIREERTGEEVENEKVLGAGDGDREVLNTSGWAAYSSLTESEITGDLRLEKKTGSSG